MWWHYASGYAFSLVVGGLLSGLLSDRLWEGLGWSKRRDALRPYPHHPKMVGFVERALYTASWQLGKPEFIAVWLALKVAGQWERWTSDVKVDGQTVVGRAIFNVFLIGNAFSIGYGVTGGLLITWLSLGAYVRAVAVSAALVIGTLLFSLWAELRKAGR